MNDLAGAPNSRESHAADIKNHSPNSGEFGVEEWHLFPFHGKGLWHAIAIVAERVKRPLGGPFELTNFSAALPTLVPGGTGHRRQMDFTHRDGRPYCGAHLGLGAALRRAPFHAQCAA